MYLSNNAAAEFSNLSNQDSHRSHTPNPLRILLIDDDSFFRNIMVQLGKLFRIQFDAFSSILDFDDFAKIERYNGVILDYHLDHINGFTVLSHLQPFIENKPKFLISSDKDIEKSCLSNNTGLDYIFLSKHLGANALIEKILQQLPRQQLDTSNPNLKQDHR